MKTDYLFLFSLFLMGVFLLPSSFGMNFDRQTPPVNCSATVDVISQCKDDLVDAQGKPLFKPSDLASVKEYWLDLKNFFCRRDLVCPGTLQNETGVSQSFLCAVILVRLNEGCGVPGFEGKGACRDSCDLITSLCPNSTQVLPDCLSWNQFPTCKQNNPEVPLNCKKPVPFLIRKSSGLYNWAWIFPIGGSLFVIVVVAVIIGSYCYYKRHEYDL